MKKRNANQYKCVLIVPDPQQLPKANRKLGDFEKNKFDTAEDNMSFMSALHLMTF